MADALEGAFLITRERLRQVCVEGWDAGHDDDEHSGGQLAMAAICYATPEHRRKYFRPNVPVPIDWPWDAKWWKPAPVTPPYLAATQDRIRELVKAGALIAAEIDRLIREVSDG